MKKIVLLFALTCLVVSCSTTKKVTENSSNQNGISVSTSVSTGNDGSSFGKAIVIKENNEMAGVKAEYAWIRQHYSNYTLKGQLLSYNNNKPYDIIVIITSDGTEKSIYFDISNFFGKF